MKILSIDAWGEPDGTRAAGEDVTWLKDGEEFKWYEGSFVDMYKD